MSFIVIQEGQHNMFQEEAMQQIFKGSNTKNNEFQSNPRNKIQRKRTTPKAMNFRFNKKLNPNEKAIPTIEDFRFNKKPYFNK